MTSPSAKRALTKAGADPRYTVAPDSEFGYSSPSRPDHRPGREPAGGHQERQAGPQAVTGQLARMQESEGVDAKYRIRAHQLDAPDRAELQASGQLRMLVGVLALGVVLLFVVVSAADALTTLRIERARALGACCSGGERRALAWLATGRPRARPGSTNRTGPNSTTSPRAATS